MTPYRNRLSLVFSLVFLIGVWIPGAAWAACLGAVAQNPLYWPALPPAQEKAKTQLAGLSLAQAQPAPRGGEVLLRFVGHATFWIQTPGGATAATDYNDYLRPPAVPDIATMNHAHSTHFTDAPDPAIKHVLRGWPYMGKPARHNLSYKDMRVRNVPTNIRRWGANDTEYDGNSIFIFEAADICIVHLGHLHHTLTPGHLADIGQSDVVLVPVDGGYTLNQVQMRDVILQLKPSLVVPMHYFSESTLERFLSLLRESHEITLSQESSIMLRRETLPKKPTVVVLPGPH